MGLIKAAQLLLKGKSMGAIKSAAPFSKTGGKTVASNVYKKGGKA